MAKPLGVKNMFDGGGKCTLRAHTLFFYTYKMEKMLFSGLLCELHAEKGSKEAASLWFRRFGFVFEAAPLQGSRLGLV